MGLPLLFDNLLMRRVVQIGLVVADEDLRASGVVDTVHSRRDVVELDERLTLLGHHDDGVYGAVALQSGYNLGLACLLGQTTRVYYMTRWRFLIVVVSLILIRLLTFRLRSAHFFLCTQKSIRSFSCIFFHSFYIYFNLTLQ